MEGGTGNLVRRFIVPPLITVALALASAVLTTLGSTWPTTPLSAADVRDATYGLRISTSADQRSQDAGGQVTYRIVATNLGTTVVQGATVIDDVPDTVSDVRWSCGGEGGATCDAGAGAGGRIAVATVLPPRSQVSVVAQGTVSDAAAGGTIVNRASVDVPSRVLIAGCVMLTSDPVVTTVPGSATSEAPMPTSRTRAGAGWRRW
jgi:uncharacterized repeat protein (TIGR01451 family)